MQFSETNVSIQVKKQNKRDKSTIYAERDSLHQIALYSYCNFPF